MYPLKRFRLFYLCVLPHLFKIPGQIPTSTPIFSPNYKQNPFEKPLLCKQSAGCSLTGFATVALHKLPDIL